MIARAEQAPLEASPATPANAKTGGRARRIVARGLLAALVALLGWAALAPIHYDTREELFEIPKGTWARRMKGEKIELLPSRIRLALGIRDVLVLRNLDDVPQIFGPTLIMPGQSFRLPFHVVSENEFMCTAHAAGQMTVIVDADPVTPPARVAWRARRAWKHVTDTALWAHIERFAVAKSE
jgi:hypothetical protein